MKKRYVLLSMAICGSLIAPSVSYAKNEQMYRTVPASKSKSGSAIIYKKPTIHSKTIKKIPPNTRWIVKLPGIKRYSRETWFKVSWNEKAGWVKKSHLVFDKKATAMVKKNPRCIKRRTRNKSCVSK